MQKSTSCHLYALGAVALWSTAYVGTKIASASYPPGAMAFLRIFSATVVLAAIAAARRRPLPARRDVPKFIASGLFGMTLYFIFFNRGFADIGATTSCILISTVPVVTALLAYSAFRERLAAAGWLAIVIAFLGIVAMTLWNGSMNINMGVVWTSLAACVFSIYNLLQRNLSKTYDSLTISLWSYAAGALLLTPFLPEAVARFPAAPASHTLIILLLGVFPSAVGSLLWVKALSLAPKTSYVTNYMFLTPFMTLVQELVIQKKWPDAGVILGGVLIMGSLALFVRAGKGR
jgi:drug/metabolite transporter (DMT)-like permease